MSVIASFTVVRDFAGPTIVNPEVLAELHELIPLAPLHQPYNLAAIEAVFERLPDVPQVACFDTSFHRGQSAVAELIPLPRELRQGGRAAIRLSRLVLRIHRFGPAGGRSRNCQRPRHRRTSRKRRESVRAERWKERRQHAGLHGRWMVSAWARRPGALDPGVVLYLFQGLKLSAKEVETMLYKKSGLARNLRNQQRHARPAGPSEPEARLAVDYFVYRAAKEIGALAAVLGGVDGLVFTAGIGENSAGDSPANLRGVRLAGHRTR